MSSLLLSVKNPCGESWNDMTPVENGRFCNACQKTVLDLSTMSDEALIRFFKNADQSYCGRLPLGKVNKILTDGTNTTQLSTSLIAVVMGATLLVSFPAISNESDLVQPKFSLTRLLTSNSYISSTQLSNDKKEMTFLVKDRKYGDPVFAAKVIAYNEEGVMITGALTDFDGQAKLSFTEEELNKLNYIEITSIEHLTIVVDAFDTATRADHYDIELNVIETETFTMGIVYTSKIESRRQRRRERRGMRKNQ